MDRYLTHFEVQMLGPIFKNTLNYGSIVCSQNDANIGGVNNSITPAGRAYFSSVFNCADFSYASPDRQWLFVHEMMHVWQWGHGIYPVIAALGIAVQTAGQYAQKGYAYDLTAGKNLIDFNIEQQASIVADYWALKSAKMAAQHNVNKNPALVDYGPLITQLQKSGPSTRKLDQMQL